MTRSKFYFIFFSCLTIILLVSYAYVTNSIAAEIHVHPGESIQGAINDSNNGDEVIVEPGTYIENINFSGKAITVRSIDPNDPNVAATTIIDGNQLNSVVTFNSGEGGDTKLCGFRVKNGKALYGGGIYCENSSPRVTNCIVSENSSRSNGGGIYANLQNNSLILKSCRIENNTSNPDSAQGNYYGGGIFFTGSDGELLLTDCLISDNSNFSHCNPWCCSVASGGGGIYVVGNATFKNCIVENNFTKACEHATGGCEKSYSYGGGIFLNSGSLSLTNCIISSNSADPFGSYSYAYGGGIYVNSGLLILTNCTVTFNSLYPTGYCHTSQAYGGGVYNANGTVIIKNSICYFNETYHLCEDTCGQIFGDVIVSYSDIQGGYEGQGNIDNDPLFLDPNAGDYHLLPDSPCIDTGDPNSSITEDIDGVLRPKDGDKDSLAQCDMGAYEYFTLFVNFNAYPKIGFAPLEVQFKNTSIDAISYNWDFGDSDTSTEENPTHIYKNSGKYTVSLTVSYGTYNVTETKENYIIVEMDLTNGLIAYYPFNGNANDESNYGNNGIVYGAILTSDRFDNPNSAYDFDGVDDFIDIGNNVKPSFPLTISAWVKLNDTATGVVFRNDNVNNQGCCYYGIEIYCSNGKIACFYGDGGYAGGFSRRTKITNDSILAVGTWHHIVGIYNGHLDIDIFMDGVKYDGSWDDGTGDSMQYSSATGAIGKQNNMYWFDGIIDDIRIYNRALSESNIKELYGIQPILQVNPGNLDFGDVLTGGIETKSLLISNKGGSTLQIIDISSNDPNFTIFPPTQFNIEPYGPGRIVNIGFSPMNEGVFSANITIENNTCMPATVNVTGNGIYDPRSGNIDTVEIIEFQNIEEGDFVEQLLTISNSGFGLLTINEAYIDNNSTFEVSTMPGDILPFTLNLDESRNLIIRFSPTEGTRNTTIVDNLIINSNDPDDPSHNITLKGNVIAPVMDPNNTILGARVYCDTYDLITSETCNNVGGEVYFSDKSTSADDFKIILTHQNGESVESDLLKAIDGSGTATFSGIDACVLPDGVVNVKVVLKREDDLFPAVIGTPAVKNTSSLEPPILDPIPPSVSFSSVIQVCGKSSPNTTVIIEGGAYKVSIDLDYDTEDFCLDVPLKRNTQNILTASAIDNLSNPPKPVASARPVHVIHIDPSEIVIAKASSRPLTTEEIEELVNKGVIDPNEPDNYNISMFTIVFTVGSSQYTISEPVVTDPNSGSVSYGRGGSITGWGFSSGGGSFSIPQPNRGGSGAHIFVITPPAPPDDGKPGMLIPGIIIIDGRIKTLKEFFQVTMAIWNTSDIFHLIDMNAIIDLPAGLTPVRAGLGTDVSHINLNGEVDNVDMGEIGPGETGIGQFIIRGDGIGTHRIDVNFEGFIDGGGLPEPIPVEGYASTSVRVLGPPELRVVVSHPVNPSGPDVSLDEIFTLKVDIKNVSDRPTLYTSLELFTDGNVIFVDPNDNPIPGSSELRTLGHIDPNETASISFRIKSLIEGDIIACQAIASENIILTINTGAECNIVNTLPANVVPLPTDYPPAVIGINPLNGQPNIPYVTSVVAIFTPQTACIEADTWTNIETENIDPNNPDKGTKIVSADLIQPGTFYLEELDYRGLPISHIPTDLTVVNPPAGGTTIAVLRLGLDAPHKNTQVFLKPDTTYRATIIGGQGGVCSDSSGLEMENTFRWTFTTEETCNELEPPMVTMVEPLHETTNCSLEQQIILSFTNRSKVTGEDSPAKMDITGFIYDPNDFLSSTFGVYVNGTNVNGDVQGGTAVSGSLNFNLTGDTLTFTPDVGTISKGDIVYIRLTDRLRDTCDNPLQTPPMGVKLFYYENFKNLQIKAGWSMISLPILPESTLLSDLFPEAVVVYCYEKGEGYVRIKKEDRMEAGKGYWILLNEEKSYPLTGKCIMNYTLTVYEKRWEMIGGCTYPAQVSVDSCEIVVIYRYVEGTGFDRVPKPEILEPGEGYWILLNGVIVQGRLTVQSTNLDL